MAQGQLPLYYKNSKPVGAAKSRTKWSEYYLLVVTLFGFLMLFAGILWFLPNIDADDGYTKAYDGFTGTEPSELIASQTSGTESVMSPVLDQRNIAPTFHSNISNISWAGNRSMAQLEQQKSNPSSAVPVLSNRPNGNVSPQDSSAADKVNTMRRNKVVEVCLMVSYAAGHNPMFTHTVYLVGHDTSWVS